MEQFPIGAIEHIGLPESTLPKEVTVALFPRSGCMQCHPYTSDVVSRTAFPLDKSVL